MSDPSTSPSNPTTGAAGSPNKRRVGILGGTFDPIHLAHLIFAEQAREQMGLDQVLFMPAGNPPHKESNEITSVKHRIEMVELAIAGVPHFDICTYETERKQVCYTVDTMAALKPRFPDAELVLLIGLDNLNDLPNWSRPDELLAEITLGVARRPGETIPDWQTLSPPLEPKSAQLAVKSIVEMPLIDISSSEIRQRIAENRSTRFLIPSAVDAYIRAHELYKSPEPS